LSGQITLHEAARSGWQRAGQPKCKETKSLKININSSIMGITERYSVK